ncbi:hypothetical protein LXA43DRAFT_1065565 [Ganoderma leucocontextum]|nr:hypothetical protein LXA43DRAFT_1065565 [Ganoderma leucocontextum]
MPFPSKVQVFHLIICPAELWRIIWTMVKDDINDEAPADPLTVLSPTLYHYTLFDIATYHFPNEELRAAIHKKVQIIGAYGSSAEKVLGPEDQAPQPPSTSFNINNTPLPLIRAAWVKTLDLTLTSPMLQNINLAETASFFICVLIEKKSAKPILYQAGRLIPMDPTNSSGREIRRQPISVLSALSPLSIFTSFNMWCFHPSILSLLQTPFSHGSKILIKQQQLEDIDDLEEAKAKGLLPSSAQDLKDFDEELGNYLYYDLKREEGNWSVDMEGEKAKVWGKKFGQYSYYAGAYMDSNISWFDVDAY